MISFAASTTLPSFSYDPNLGLSFGIRKMTLRFPRPSLPVFPLTRKVPRSISGFALTKIEKAKDLYWGKCTALFSWSAARFVTESEAFRYVCRFSFKAPCLIAMAFLIKSQACAVVCLEKSYPFLSRSYLPSIWLMRGGGEPAGGLVDICPFL